VETDTQTDRHTHTQTHKPSTVTLAARARRGLKMELFNPAIIFPVTAKLIF